MNIDTRLLKLTDKRNDWVRINRENGFDKGIKSILTKLYPKKAHFIYELLQNSEDAGADLVRFKLGKTGLGYEHNGSKQFTYLDIDSITGIGNSTKLDEPTNIGKFGVGFKAVYSYTKSPEIHSGGYDFRIEEMVVPVTEGVRPQKNDKNTMFYFPFDIPDEKPAEEAVFEIGEALRYLDDITLLFLQNIKRIEYDFTDSCCQEFAKKIDLEIFGEKPGSIELKEMENHHVRIESVDPTGKVRISDWLKFDKIVDVQDDGGLITNCRIAVAFALDTDSDGSSWIAPSYPGKVCIFFPAEKETSNLRFHIHAPFASTVGRDSIRSCSGNDKLRDKLTELVADSLTSIRDMGMLRVKSLAVFPNNNDYLYSNSKFYEPFQKAIIQAFKTCELTPCKEGGFAKAEQLIRGPSRISGVLGDSELHQLFGKPTPIWVTNAAMVNSPEDRFLSSLQIKEFSWKELVPSLRGYSALPGGFKSNDQILQIFIQGRTDSWLNTFYALMGEANYDFNSSLNFNTVCMIRITNGTGIDHVLSNKALLPPDEWTLNNDGIPMVKQEVREMKTDYQKKYLPIFFENVGVRKYSTTTIIEQRLERYVPNLPYNASHLKEVATYINHLKQNPQDIGIFTKHAFLYSDSAGNPGKNYSPGNLCIDLPYIKTGLSSEYGCHRKPPIWVGYSEYNGFNLSDFTSFVLKLGILVDLKVVKTAQFSLLLQKQIKDDFKYIKETSKAIRIDYSIDHLEDYLRSNKNIEINRLIWNALISAPPEASQAHYRPNNTYEEKTYKSSLIQYLKINKWVPDVSGELFVPYAIDPDRLDEHLRIDHANGLLKEIGFGAEAERRTNEYQRKNSSAISIGFNSVEQAERFASIARLCESLGKSPEEFELELQTLQGKRAPEFPEGKVSNKDRRKQKIQEGYDESSLKIYEKKELSVNISRNSIDPRTWLENHYTNRHGEMVCQICSQEMPFKKRSGSYYFEAVEIFTNYLLKKENEANYIALCPLCSAKYQEYVKQDTDAMEKIKSAIQEAAEEQNEIDIILDSNTPKASIRFVQTHLFDLKIFLEAINNGGEVKL